MDEGFAVIGVIPVVALNAVVEQVTDVGVGVYQLQELQCFFGIGAVSGDAVQRAADSFIGNDGRTPLLGNALNAELRPQEVIAAPDQPCAMEQAL